MMLNVEYRFFFCGHKELAGNYILETYNSYYNTPKTYF